MSRNLELAQRFFAASSAGNTEAMAALCSDRILVQQNGGDALGLTALLGFAAAVKAAAPDFRYENAIRYDTGTGFVEEHDVRGTVKDGSAFKVAVCVVATVEDGRIATMHEYLDTAAARPLVEALSRPRG